jgi:hypothetical protein
LKSCLLETVDLALGFIFQRSYSIWKLEKYYATYQYLSKLRGATSFVTDVVPFSSVRLFGLNFLLFHVCNIMVFHLSSKIR